MGHLVFSLVIDIPHTLFMSPSFSIPSEHSVAVRLLYCQFLFCVSLVCIVISLRKASVRRPKRWKSSFTTLVVIIIIPSPST